MIILAVARMFSVRKGVVKNFVKVTSEHLSQSLFLNKIPGSMWGSNVIENRFWERCFPLNLQNIL